jgi:hypothetical protein
MKKSLIFTMISAAMALYAGESEFIRQELVCGGAAQQFRLNASKPEHFNRKPIEASCVQADNDQNNLYLTITMKDNDIMGEAEKNQSSLGSFGDAVQIFLKSEKETFFWEFQADPFGKKSCFFHPGAGRIFYPEAGSEFPDFTVENTRADGEWKIKITIPLSIFREKGFKFTNDENWTFMIVRHNFSRFNDAKEASSYPQAVGRIYNPDRFGKLIIK